MSLNIKNERTHALVRELATLTGVSQTQAVEDAVQRRLDELRAEPTRKGATADELLALGREIASRLGPESFEPMEEWLYDENGLPK